MEVDEKDQDEDTCKKDKLGVYDITDSQEEVSPLRPLRAQKNIQNDMSSVVSRERKRCVEASSSSYDKYVGSTSGCSDGVAYVFSPDLVRISSQMEKIQGRVSTCISIDKNTMTTLIVLLLWN